MTTRMNPTQYGPDRATAQSWLDREPRPVIGPASLLRELRRRAGAPIRIRRDTNARRYTFLQGFDRITVSIFLP